jgi:transcriptional regulator GlxA family with amidase domain
VSLALESVASIGAKWGFIDPARFSRVVREATGLPPREYRRAG